MEVQGPVLITVEDGHLPEVVARLREFCGEGITIDKAYPLANPSGQVNMIAFIVAQSQRLFDEFIQIIMSYIGITTCTGYPQYPDLTQESPI